MDSSGNLYVVDIPNSGGDGRADIRKFTPAGTEVPAYLEDGFDASIGIAASSACGIPGMDLYVGNASFTNSFVRTYGPPPNPISAHPRQSHRRSPPSTRPRSTAAAPRSRPKSIPTSGPTPPTTCSTAPANAPKEAVTKSSRWHQGPSSPPRQPPRTSPRPANSSTVSSPTPPITTASSPRARVAARCAESAGEEGSDGAEGTFSTFPAPAAPKTDCPNQAFRTGVSAPLPDCRAYEMVSPVDKGGDDVFSPVLPSALPRPRAPPTGSGSPSPRLALRRRGSFAVGQPVPLAPRSNGWSARSVSPPRPTPHSNPPT